MSTFQKSAIVPYSATEMYQLVNDIEKYREFIPWCASSKILSKDEHEIKATLCFARGGIQKCFTTCNRLQPEKMIGISLVHGPFKRLHGFWRFDSLPDHHCKISFDVDFEFSSMLISLAFGPFFNQITSRLVDAFVERAKKLYGERKKLDGL